jgi:benzodiazapine receptor
MTTYIPSLTLPSIIFENAALSVLFPIVAGTAVGFSTQRKHDIHSTTVVIVVLTSS